MTKTISLSDLPAGPPSGTVIADLGELPEHGGKTIDYQKDDKITSVLVQRFNGAIYVYENNCPHAGTPLNMFNDKLLDITGQNLICRTHGAQFKPQTGFCWLGPCKGQSLIPIAFEIVDDKIISL